MARSFYELRLSFRIESKDEPIGKLIRDALQLECFRSVNTLANSMSDLVTPVHQESYLSAQAPIIRIKHYLELIADDCVEATNQLFQINRCRISAPFKPGLSKCPNEPTGLLGDIRPTHFHRDLLQIAT